MKTYADIKKGDFVYVVYTAKGVSKSGEGVVVSSGNKFLSVDVTHHLSYPTIVKFNKHKEYREETDYIPNYTLFISEAQYLSFKERQDTISAIVSLCRNIGYDLKKKDTEYIKRLHDILDEL